MATRRNIKAQQKAAQKESRLIPQESAKLRKLGLMTRHNTPIYSDITDTAGT